MKRWTTSKGTCIDLLTAGRSNTYLIRCHREAILIDTGKTQRYEVLVSRLHQLLSEEQRMNLKLILTHTHFDHCQNTVRLKADLNCTILVSRQASGHIRSGYTPLPKGTTLPTKILSYLGRKIGSLKYGYPPFYADVLIGDKERYALTECIKIITTPGHSSDSLSVVIDDEVALVGDTLFGIFPGSVFPPYADNAPVLIESWRRLLHTPCTVFLPGHGGKIERELFEYEFGRFKSKT